MEVGARAFELIEATRDQVDLQKYFFTFHRGIKTKRWQEERIDSKN